MAPGPFIDLIESQRRLIAALDAVIAKKDAEIANLRRCLELCAQIEDPYAQEMSPQMHDGCWRIM